MTEPMEEIRVTIPASAAAVLRGREAEVAKAIVDLAARLEKQEGRFDPSKLSARLRNALEHHGIVDLRQLSVYTWREIRRWRNVGAGTLAELRRLLDERGITLED
jgi:DNA-directed RNA polymerase alpha subunit